MKKYGKDVCPKCYGTGCQCGGIGLTCHGCCSCKAGEEERERRTNALIEVAGICRLRVDKNGIRILVKKGE